jgi:hypothetical protein
MSLYEKIVAKHPELTADDFHPATGSILLVDDSDGFGPYIAKWEHPTLPQPSDEELGITRNAANVIIEGEIIEPAPMMIGEMVDLTPADAPVVEPVEEAAAEPVEETPAE